MPQTNRQLACPDFHLNPRLLISTGFLLTALALALSPTSISALPASTSNLLFPAHNSAQAPANPHSPSPVTPHRKQPSAKPANPAEAELRARVLAAQEARASGNPAAIAVANRRLLALALREIAQLRLLENALPQSSDLYLRSLDFEDSTDARVDLAISYLQAVRLPEALKEVDRALAQNPHDPRALGVRGRILLAQQDFPAAAAALKSSAEISPDFETYYSQAIALLEQKTPDTQKQAAATFQKAINLMGDTGSIHVFFGRAYRDANYMPEAIAQFQRAIALDPHTPHAHYFLGLAHLAVNEWKPTPEVFQEINLELSNYPKDYLSNYMLGFLAAGERDFPTSNRYLHTALEINSSAPEPWLYLGLNAYAQKDFPAAEQSFRKAIELTGTDESRSNYQIRRAYVDLGRILATSGRTEESESYLAKARDLQNKTMQETQQSVSAIALAGGAGSAAAIVPLGTRAESQAALTPTSISGADSLFSRLDASAISHSALTEKERAAADSQENRLRAVLGLGFNDLATSEAVEGAFRVALTHYQEAEKWDPTVDGLYRNLGLAAYRVQDYPEAIRGLSASLQKNPTDPAARSILGMSYFASDKFADAAKTFSPLGSRGMQDPTVGYAWAAALARSGDLKPASAVLSAYEQANTSPESRLLIGQLWIEIGDYSRAVAVLQSASQSQPTLLKAHYFAGQAYLRWTHWPEAAEQFQAELALHPADYDARYNLGFVLVQQSKIPEAEKMFSEVIAAAPRYANARYELGKIQLERGQLPEAIANLEIAAQENPQADYIHYQLQAAYRKASRNDDAERELQLYKDLKAHKRDLSTVPPSSP